MRLALAPGLGVLLVGCVAEPPPPRYVEFTFDQPRFDLWFYDLQYCALLPGDHIDTDTDPFVDNNPSTVLSREFEEQIREIASDGLSAREAPFSNGCKDVLLIDRERQEQTPVSTIWFYEEQRFIPSHFDLPADVWAPVYDSRTLR